MEQNQKRKPGSRNVIELVDQSLQTWAPSWPRRVTIYQEWSDNRENAAQLLDEAQNEDGVEPFISVYSFPDGHSRKGNVPRIDTLFIDFDFEDGDYQGDGNRDAWRRDLSQLLVRVRRVADFLVTQGATGWRASLSGHKGVHLFLDFPPLDRDLGDLAQYKLGLGQYADELVDRLADETGMDSLHDYVDVTSSDMGRLCRVPNTLHGGATASFGEPRFCVNVSLEELSDITIDTYEELTRRPRPPALQERDPNEDVGRRVRQHVVTATPESGGSMSYGEVDWARVDKYRKKSNDNITLDDVPILLTDRPYIAEFPHRDDVWDHGNQSHFMEVCAMAELANKDVPIDVIKEFIGQAPDFNERYTDQKIRQVIAQDYSRFTEEKIRQKAPIFYNK